MRLSGADERHPGFGDLNPTPFRLAEGNVDPEASLWIVREGRVVQALSLPAGPAVSRVRMGVEVYWANNGVLLLSWSLHQLAGDRVESSRAYVQAVGCLEESP